MDSPTNMKRDEVERVLSSLNTGLALINPDLTVAWGNEVTRGILPWDSLIGKKCYEATANRNEPCEGCGALQAFGDGKVHETERQSPVDGRWHFIVSTPVKDSKGQTVQVLESVTDITERKKTELARDRALRELAELKKKLEEENNYLKTEVYNAKHFDRIVGTSNAMHYVVNRVRQVARTTSTVLITGETGVGKELVARAIHDSSKRSGKPFITVNCAALTPSLAESEFFGHERGAFTDAKQCRKGRFELADGGTLFLDEVGELDLRVQAKLLRVLEDGNFERVGGTEKKKSDVRVITATNRNLNEETRDGRFRADLLYRLSVFPITVPPLRKRVEDIPILIDHFIQYYNSELGRKVGGLSKKDIKKLMRYHWPGNVRELKNIIGRAMVTSINSRLVIQEFSCNRISYKNKYRTLSQKEEKPLLPMIEVERRHIKKVLDKTGGQINGPAGAAYILKMNPSTLRSRIKRLKTLEDR